MSEGNFRVWGIASVAVGLFVIMGVIVLDIDLRIERSQRLLGDDEPSLPAGMSTDIDVINVVTAIAFVAFVAFVALVAGSCRWTRSRAG